MDSATASQVKLLANAMFWSERMAEVFLRKVGGFGSLAVVGEKRIADVCKGIGHKSIDQNGEARRLRSVILLGREILFSDLGDSLDEPRKVVSEVRELITNDVEEMWVVPVDASLRSKGAVKVAIGGPNSCPASPIDVVRATLKADAVGMFVAHSHPTGLTAPSRQDKTFTVALEKMANSIGLILYDHIVIGRGEWCSVVTGNCAPLVADDAIERKAIVDAHALTL